MKKLFFYSVKEHWDALEKAINTWKQDKNWESLEREAKNALNKLPLSYSSRLDFWKYIDRFLRMNNESRLQKLIDTARLDYEPRLWFKIALYPFRLIYKIFKV